MFLVAYIALRNSTTVVVHITLTSNVARESMTARAQRTNSTVTWQTVNRLRMVTSSWWPNKTTLTQNPHISASFVIKLSVTKVFSAQGWISTMRRSVMKDPRMLVLSVVSNLLMNYIWKSTLSISVNGSQTLRWKTNKIRIMNSNRIIRHIPSPMRTKTATPTKVNTRKTSSKSMIFKRVWSAMIQTPTRWSSKTDWTSKTASSTQSFSHCSRFLCSETPS